MTNDIINGILIPFFFLQMRTTFPIVKPCHSEETGLVLISWCDQKAENRSKTIDGWQEWALTSYPQFQHHGWKQFFPYLNMFKTISVFRLNSVYSKCHVNCWLWKGPWIDITIYLILKVNNSFNILPQMLCLSPDFLKQKEAKRVTNHW